MLRARIRRKRWLVGAAWLGLVGGVAMGAALPPKAVSAAPSATTAPRPPALPTTAPRPPTLSSNASYQPALATNVSHPPALATPAPRPPALPTNAPRSPALPTNASRSPALPTNASRPPALPVAAALVPLVRQQTSYSCGPAALASVLRYFHVWDGTEQQLYPVLGTSPEEGTLPEMLAAGAQHFGLRATVAQPLTIPALRSALGAGQLVILELQAWPTPGTPPVPWADRWDDGHYVVLFALDDRYAYFMDPSVDAAYTYLALTELVPRWHDINESRAVPLAPHDHQLGVLIGKPVTPLRTVPIVWSPGPLQPLRKLE